MDERSRDKIYSTLNLKETTDLIEIWQENDTDAWEKETFAIIKQILIERLGFVPPRSINAQVKEILKRVAGHWEAGEIEKALSDCNLAIELAPDLPAAYNYRGMILEDIGKLDQAFADYQEAIRIDPEWKDARDNLKLVENAIASEWLRSESKQHLDQALGFAHNEEPRQALEECELARPTLPPIALAYNYLGLIFEELGQLEPAIAAYLEATSLNPHFSAARQNLRNARVRLEEEQYHLADLENWQGAQEENTAPDEDEMPPDFADLPGADLAENVDPAPGWLYLNEASFVMSGWPGHRNRPGRCGLDYLDTSFEEAHMEGVMIRLLVTLRFRTRNPFYLAGMTLLGFLFCLPLVFGGIALLQGEWYFIFPFFIYIPISVAGVALLVNVWLSLGVKQSYNYAEGDSSFF
jgi:tetratricopeptide (TPR) repeat protein